MNNGFIGKPIINNTPGRLFDIGMKSSSDSGKRMNKG